VLGTRRLLANLSMAGLDPAIQGHTFEALRFQPLDGRLEGGHDVSRGH
jgi:hypothetical protein